MDSSRMQWLITVMLLGLLTEVASYSMETLSMRGHMHDPMPSVMDGCPTGQIYCFLRERCVMLDGTCPPSPNCQPHEYLHWNEAGFEECLPSEATYCPAGQIFCMQRHMCVNMDGSCVHHVCSEGEELRWNSEYGYDECVPAHEDDHTWCSPGQIFCILRNRCINLDGSCDIICAHDEHIVWNSDGSQECWPDDHHHDDDTYCPPGQIYCIQRERCVNLDGSCPIRCGPDEHIVLNSDGSQECMPDHHHDDGTYCPTGQIYCMQREKCVNLDGSCPITCGPDEYMAWNSDGSQTCMPDHHDDGTYCPPEQIYCMQRERCVNLDGSCPGVTCGPDEELIWYSDSHQECVPYNDDEYHYCPAGQIFCLMTGTCVNMDGSCHGNEGCPDGEESRWSTGQEICVPRDDCDNSDMSTTWMVKCYKDGTVQCVDNDYCSYISVSLYIDADYNAVFGNHHDYHVYQRVTNLWMGQLASEFSVSAEKIWDVNAYSGSINLSFKIPVTTVTMATVETIMYRDMPQFLQDENGTTLHIDWLSSYNYLHNPGGDVCTSADCTHSGCDYGSLLDLSAGFPQCIEPERRSENTYCSFGEVFCLLSGKCVREDGSCADPQCPHNYMLCYGDEQLECVPEGECEMVSFVFNIDANLDELVGEHYRNYYRVTNHIKRQLVMAIGLNSSDVWNLVLWQQGSIGVLFYGSPDIKDTVAHMFEVIREQFLTRDDGSMLTILWDSLMMVDGAIDNDNEGDSCDSGEIYCLMAQECVTMQGQCYRGNGSMPECPDNEMMCYWNIAGLQHCASECHVFPVTVTFYLDGDFSGVANDVTGFLDTLQQTMATMLNISVDNMQNMMAFPGSIGISFDLTPFEGMEGALHNIQTYVNIGGELLGYNIIPGNASFMPPDWTDQGKECSTDQIYCLMAQECVPVDTLGTCQPDQNETMCYENEILCMWSNGTFYCSETDSCNDTHYDGPTHDHFIVRLPVSSVEDFLESFTTQVDATTTIDDVVNAFTDSLLEEFRAKFPADVDVQTVSVQPGDQAGTYLGVYVDLITELAVYTKHQLLVIVGRLTFESLKPVPDMNITIAQVNDEAPIAVFTINEAVVKDRPYSFNMHSILPLEHQDDVPPHLQIDCEMNVQVLATDGTFGQSAVVDSSVEITLRHNHTHPTLDGCRVSNPAEPAEEMDREYVIGILAVPATLYQMARDVDIELNGTELVLHEDSPCTPLPTHMFYLHNEGDEILALFRDWHVYQEDHGEIWQTGIPIGIMIQNILLHYHRYRTKAHASLRAAVRVSDDTKFTADNTLKAKFKITDGTMVEGTSGAGLLTHSESMMICLARDFSGNFTLEVTREDVESEPILIHVTVVSTNDKPAVRMGLDLKYGLPIMSYPAVPLPGDTEVQVVPEFKVGDVADYLFYDKDVKQTLGLAVLGYLMGGTWEVSPDGSTWTDITQVVTPTGDAYNTTVLLLQPDVLIRAIPADRYINITWTSRQAMRLAVLAWDMSNMADLEDPAEDYIQMKSCSTLMKDSLGGYCVMDDPEYSAYSSKVLVLPLARHGCDGVLNSGKSMLVCGCGLDKGCQDCMDVPYGDAVLDMCGQCVARQADLIPAINCSLPACQTTHKQFCDRQAEAEAELNSVCDSDMKINTAFEKGSPVCGELCIPEADQPFVDQCGIQCGADTCLDCDGVVDGNKVVNLCGVCKDPNNINEGCTSIGNMVPDTLYEWASVNISVDVVPELYTTSTPTISCLFEHKNDSTTGNVPSVLQSFYNATEYVITLTVDAAGTVGEFAIQCDTDLGPVSTADQDQYVTIFNHPVLTDISPSSALITDLTEISLMGTGIIDTGLVLCMIPCSELGFECQNYVHVRGTYVNDTTVTCLVGKLKSTRIGKTYHVSVILDFPDMVDLNSIPTGKEFTVMMPAPNGVSATLDMNGCYVIEVIFDAPISKSEDHLCSNYFDDNTISTLSLNPTNSGCKVFGRTMHIGYTNPIPAGSVLTLRDNAIRHVAEENEVNANFATGSVTVEADASGEGAPVVSILHEKLPSHVGCNDVFLKTKVENRGCWEPVITWVVTADQDPLTEPVNDSLVVLNALAQENVFVINGDHLVDGVAYIFTMSFTASVHSGSDSVQLEKDTDVDASLTIYVREMVDAESKIGLKADFTTCLNTENQIEYEWSLDPMYVFSDDKQTRRTYIPANSLLYDTEYTLTCTAFYMSKSITETAVFRTEPMPIETGMLLGGDLLTSSTREVRSGEDVQLECVNRADRRNELDDEIICTWSCRDNVFVGEDEFLACLEVTATGFTPVKRMGNIVNVTAATVTPPWDLVQIWTLTMTHGESEGVSIERRIHYKPVPVQLVSPEISVKKSSYVITDSTSLLEIPAKCRKTTKYAWVPGASGSIELPIASVTKGHLVHDISYDGATYSPCGIGLSLDIDNLIAGVSYTLTIEAYNQDGNFYLSTGTDIEILVISIPVPGGIVVYFTDENITALTTPLSISLDGWWDAVDGTDLQCNFFYQESGSAPIKINAIPNPVEQGLVDFTLPEGTFTISAKCCNGYGECAKMSMENELTVVAIDTSALLDVISNSLAAISGQGGTDDFLNMLANIASTWKNTELSDEEIEQTQAPLKEASNNAIQNALSTSDGDAESTLGALESTSLIAMQAPENIDPETKLAMQDSCSEVALEKTGQDTETRRRRRRKRSVGDSEDPDGLLENEALILLEAYDATLSQGSLTKQEATMYLGTIENVMIGLCQAFTGTDPWQVLAGYASVRALRSDMMGLAAVESDIGCDNCSHVDYPATVKYGGHLEAAYNGSWSCSSESSCIDVCMASVQLNIDTVTLTSPMETVAPTRKSDLVILRLINPETYQVEDTTALNDPVQVELALTEPVDTDTYDYKCMMWVNNVWSDSECTETTPALEADVNVTVCSCSGLGILGVFQELKPDPDQTTTSTTPTTTTTVATTMTTAAPSKSLETDTDVLDMKFTLNNDYETIVTSYSDFTASMKSQLVSQTGIPASCFRNIEAEEGSIVVSFEVVDNAAQLTLGQMAYTLEDMFTNGAVTFTAPGGGALALQPGSFTLAEKNSAHNDDKKKKDGDKSLLYIIGGALGGLIIIGVVVVIVVYIVNKNKHRTHPLPSTSAGHPSQPQPPPPDYALAPPPPYIYDPPPITNKWVEDEMIDKSENRAQSSTKSGKAGERKITSGKGNPTPVD